MARRTFFCRRTLFSWLNVRLGLEALEDQAGPAVSFCPAVNFTAGDQPVSVAGGDFNGDGKQDLATANASGNNVSVLRNTTNSAPTLSVPGDQIAYKDVDKRILGIKVGDPDSNSLTVTLSVGHGTLTLTSGSQIISGSSGTLSGSICELNALLATLSYRGAVKFSGDDTLQIGVSDGSLSASASVAIHVKSAAEQAADLNAQVEAGVLTDGQGEALSVNLRDNKGDAGKVHVFLNQVQDFLDARILTQAPAGALLEPGDVLLLSVTRR
jgi:hypothetical protein